MSTVGLRSTLREVLSGIFKVVSTSSPRTKTVSVTTPEAYLKWGDESEFNYVGSFDGFQVIDAYDPLQGDLYEEGCKYSDISVENPEDTSQKVVVRRYDAIAFTARMKPTHRADATNPHPQVMMSFSNYDGSPAYTSKKGQEFHPIALDPFNTIVEVSWSSKNYLVFAVAISPIMDLQVQLGTDDESMTAIIPSFVTSIATGQKVRGENDGLNEAFIPARYVLGSSTPVTYPNCAQTGGASWPTCFQFHEVFENGVYSYRYMINPTNGNIVAFETYVEPAFSSFSQKVARDFQINLYSDGTPIDGNTDPYKKSSFWKSIGLAQVYSTGSTNGGTIDLHIYAKFYTAWRVRYDPSPYCYYLFKIDLDEMVTQFATLYPDNVQNYADLRLKIVARGTDIRQQWSEEEVQPAYTGFGSARVTWYRGGSDVEKGIEDLSEAIPSTYIDQTTFLETIHSSLGAVSDGTFSLPDGLNIQATDTTIATFSLDWTNSTVGVA